MAPTSRASQRPFTPSEADRAIAVTRVVLALLSLTTIWADPSASPFKTTTYALHITYVVYAAALLAVVWSRVRSSPLTMAAYAADLIFFCTFQYLTVGASTPFFIYFVFALFSAALRWGWRGTMRAFPLVVIAFTLTSLAVRPEFNPAGFELNRFMPRLSFLLMVGSLLVYLGRHEAERREEIQQLARWPAPTDDDAPSQIRMAVEYAASLVSAKTAIVVWSDHDEPRTMMARWSGDSFAVTTHGPAEVDPIVPAEIDADAFVWAIPAAVDTPVAMQRGSRTVTWRGVPLHSMIAAQLPGGSAGSAAFHSDRVSGRAFFSWIGEPGTDVLPLLEAVTRQIGASLDHVSARQHHHRISVSEERLRLARDLHDGVLQSLTGVRFELQRIAHTMPAEIAGDTRDRLLTMERALSLEQRELRLFIEDLKPFSGAGAGDSLQGRLEDVRQRLRTQWQVPIDLHFEAPMGAVPRAIDHALVPMVQEAVVNALKHGQPSRIRVTVRTEDGALRVTVADDGRGFEFTGRLEHDVLAARKLGPVSLRERLASLGGKLSIESHPSGARVEMLVPVGAAAH